MDAYISIGRYVKDKLTTVRAVLKTDLTNGDWAAEVAFLRSFSRAFVFLFDVALCLLNRLTCSNPVDQHCVVTSHLYIRSLNKQLHRKILGRLI